jgi:CDP-4-dehydro-6-deoxyglucose reductase
MNPDVGLRKYSQTNTKVLISRLKSLSGVLIEEAAALEAAEGILEELDARLATMIGSEDPDKVACSREIQTWVAAERRKLAVRPDAESRAQLFAKDTFLRITSANVKIVPSGHDFFVEGTGSIAIEALG